MDVVMDVTMVRLGCGNWIGVGGGMIRVLIWQYFAVILFTYFKMCYMYKGWVLNVWINMTMMRLGFGDWMASRGGGGGEGGG